MRGRSGEFGERVREWVETLSPDSEVLTCVCSVADLDDPVTKLKCVRCLVGGAVWLGDLLDYWGGQVVRVVTLYM